MDSMNPNPAQQLAKLGKAIKGMGPAVAPRQACSVNEQMARSVELSRRRSVFRGRMAAIRYRVQDQGRETAGKLMADRMMRAVRIDRYLRNASLALCILAILAGLAFIATNAIGGAA